jgi:hypothetical protein
MTLKAFIGFSRKPNKSPGAAVARAFGMKEKPNSSEFEWVFQKSKFRVMLEDLREQMKPELREWADDVGWTYNYAIQIAVHTKRDSLDYLKWVALITVLMEAYEATTVWYDEGTDTPQERLKLTEFAPLAIEYSEEGAIENELLEENELLDSPPKLEEPTIEVDDEFPPGLMAMIRKELNTTPEPKPEVKLPEPSLTLKPVISDEEEFEDFEDWDDDEDEDEDEDEVHPVTWDDEVHPVTWD